MMKIKSTNEQQQTATFAGGCFWCVESDFEKFDGVVEAISGYAGGQTENPTYREVSAGGTGHAEVVRVLYDPKKITYDELLDIFWQHVDPTDPGGQFVDRGSQYRSAIFYHDEFQIECLPEYKERISFLAEQSIYEAGEYYKLSVPQKGESKCGRNWFETH